MSAVAEIVGFDNTNAMTKKQALEWLSVPDGMLKFVNYGQGYAWMNLGTGELVKAVERTEPKSQLNSWLGGLQ